jgi:hypothetical protein
MAETTLPTADESIRDLQELLAIWGHSSNPVMVQIMDDSWVRAAMVRVQADHAVALARAAIVLIDNEMFIQSAPLIRQMWECSITGAWAATTTNSGQGLLAEADRSHALVMKALGAMAGEPDVEVEDLVGEWQEFRTPESKQIEQRCRALDGGKWLYAYFRLLSQFSHGDGALFSQYIEVGEVRSEFGHPWAFRNMREFPYTDTVLGLAVVALHLTMLAWDEVSDGHPWEERLAAFADAHGIRSSLRGFR